jgi:hypothetical protein
MGHERTCPECGANARWVATAIECEDWMSAMTIVETQTHYCPLCDKFWDVHVNESGATRVCQAVGDSMARPAAVLCR